MPTTPRAGGALYGRVGRLEVRQDTVMRAGQDTREQWRRRLTFGYWLQRYSPEGWRELTHFYAVCPTLGNGELDQTSEAWRQQLQRIEHWYSLMLEEQRQNGGYITFTHWPYRVRMPALAAQTGGEQ